MKISIESCIYPNISTLKFPKYFIEIEDQNFDKGGQAPIYKVLKIDDKEIEEELLVKHFESGIPNNLRQIVKVISDNDKKYKISECIALRSLPLFLFEGHANGKPFHGYVMRKMKGKTFDKILKYELQYYLKLSIKDRIKLCFQFTEGMNILYQLTIIHADINSKNLMIDIENKTLSIIDLDGGAVAERRQIPTVFGKPVTDFHWMAPEIFSQYKKGEKIEVNISADEWSTACGIHYLLFGMSPYFFITKEYDIEKYLKTYKWPKWPYGNDIDTINEDWFRYYESVYKKVPNLHEFLEHSFNKGYFKENNRISTAIWELTLKRNVCYLDEVPKLKINKNHFDFLDMKLHDYDTDVIVISNTGRGRLIGNIKSNREWLRIIMSDINTTDTQQNSFGIIARYLNGLEDTGIITVETNGGKAEIKVDVSIRANENIQKNKEIILPGSGIVKCMYCDGSGKHQNQTCTVCGGIGKVEVVDSNQECYYCKNRGYLLSGIPCQVCRGTGYTKPLKNPRLGIKEKNFKFFDIKKNHLESDFLKIGNIGNGRLIGNIKSNRKWLTFNRYDDIVNFDITNRYSLLFNIRTNDLPLGLKDTGTIEITSNGGNENIYIEISVENRTKKIMRSIKNIFKK